MIVRLSHISLYSNSLRKVKKFYCEFLNLKVSHYFKNSKNEEYGLFLNTNKDTFIEFFLSKKRRKKGSVYNHLCFSVKNIVQVRKKLIKNKVDCSSLKLGKSDKVLQFTCKDLENNIIEFHQL